MIPVPRLKFVIEFKLIYLSEYFVERFNKGLPCQLVVKL